MVRTRKSTRRVVGVATDLMLAPAVIGMRMPLLAAEAQSGNGQIGVETMRAVSEKAAAMADGVFAAQLSMANAAMMFWPELLSGRTPSLLSGAAIEKAMHEALWPVRRTVKANYRRLRAK